jgi:cytochrome c5
VSLAGIQSSAQSELELVRLHRFLAPIGEVCLAGEDCAGRVGTPMAMPSTTPSTGAPAAGGFDVAETYRLNCFACHSSGAAGAPRTGDAAAWNARIEAKGMDTVIQNAVNGINAMPAKGMCMSCTNEQIRNLVDFMIEGGQ